MEKLLYTVEEAESLTSICRSKLYVFMESGALPSIKIGRSRRIPRADLEDFIERLRRGVSIEEMATTYEVAD